MNRNKTLQAAEVTRELAWRDKEAREMIQVEKSKDKEPENGKWAEVKPFYPY